VKSPRLAASGFKSILRGRRRRRKRKCVLTAVVALRASISFREQQGSHIFEVL
jgi:hypothetical protein